MSGTEHIVLELGYYQCTFLLPTRHRNYLVLQRLLLGQQSDAVASPLERYGRSKNTVHTRQLLQLGQGIDTSVALRSAVQFLHGHHVGRSLVYYPGYPLIIPHLVQANAIMHIVGQNSHLLCLLASTEAGQQHSRCQHRFHALHYISFFHASDFIHHITYYPTIIRCLPDKLPPTPYAGCRASA